MKKIGLRSVSVYILILLIVMGMTFFTARLFLNGSEWASFRSNGNAYKNGILKSGAILDRDGVLLAKFTENGVSYAEDPVIRAATLHLIGDRERNIAYGAKEIYKEKLTGYNFVNGVYSAEKTELTLSVSAKLCKTAYEALDRRSGCIGIVNYKTGEMVCMVSSPTFDPDNVPQISKDDTSGVYLNRFLSSAYVPGSVFKLVTLAAAIENIDELYDRTFHCDGRVNIGDGTVTCTNTHGDMKIEDALANSCNCVFAALADELGADTVFSYAEKLGLTESHSIDGAPTAAGRYDKAGDGSIELAWSGVGQYNDMENPASFLRFVSAVANSGVACEMTFLKGGKTRSERLMSSETAEKIADMMDYCVKLTYGDDNFPGLDICAKSGTAEVGGGKKPHSWFVGFLQNEDAPYAFVVVIENGGWGSVEAGNAANKVLKAALTIK